MPRNRRQSYGRKSKVRGKRSMRVKPNPRRARAGGKYYVGGTVF